ncbi:(2Fe-2S)-binding protein [Thauera mechernichensis]|uniref:Bacterioferritin-associated ferredoxin n=1 Tax=Thauera mechernichensis TaxID=82788 RepID=A0ABW3W7T4_9RHOO|nr:MULTISPECIES: (2Fe-2S)-binding protein [Thauera]ENO74684.1 BFD domain-containing protein (2Fe-2S)-binding domain-containing protein [Thauera sp. 27]MDG3063541.1 (2Fe-2S)-binding protein [Thauera mechernichensis]WBL63521.1 (2Fe-2S)-binding protein [Thauera sp. WB-2]HAG74055.1 (2Fe-2S)-binding protein [Thauera sp.]HAY08616.1 (2Fe-2S)-binding protein [Thauera sp.]
MYVCVCLGVTERQIEQAARAGARRLRDLRAELGVTTECATCARHAHSCLRAAIDCQAGNETLATARQTLHPNQFALEAAA